MGARRDHEGSRPDALFAGQVEGQQFCDALALELLDFDWNGDLGAELQRLGDGAAS